MTRRRPLEFNRFIILALVAVWLQIQPSVAFGQPEALLSAANNKQDNAEPDSQPLSCINNMAKIR